MPAAASTTLPPFCQEMRGKHQIALFHVVVCAFYQRFRLIWLVILCHLSADLVEKTCGPAKGSEKPSENK